MIFYSFKLFHETAEYYAGLNFLPNTRTSFLCTGRLVAWKVSVTIWEQHHDAVSHALQIYQTFNTLPSPHTVSFQWPKSFIFIIWCLDVPAEHVAGQREIMDVFSCVFPDGIIRASVIDVKIMVFIHKAGNTSFWILTVAKQEHLPIQANAAHNMAHHPSGNLQLCLFFVPKLVTEWDRQISYESVR